MWLWEAMTASGALSDRLLIGAERRLPLAQLATASTLGGRLEELRGRSVIVSYPDQLSVAAALIELDGVARRIVLCASDLSAAHLSLVAREAEADAWVGDQNRVGLVELHPPTIIAPGAMVRSKVERRRTEETEWVLLTSGSTGAPKLVVHSLASLTNAFIGKDAPAPEVVWSTFYEVCRYGGLQVLLRGLLGGSLMLWNSTESIVDFLSRACECGVTHISGTPSHWRKAMISGSIARLHPRYIRLSGEIVDQAVLDALGRTFHDAAIVHAFASTEAGVGFEVTDRRTGFPANLVAAPNLPAEIDVTGGRLRLRSAGNARCYLGADVPLLKGADGFVDTGDRLERRGDRYHFIGRSGGIINVGGQKVHPEEVEAVINSQAGVYVSRVAARKNPITGAIVVAEVVRSPVTQFSTQSLSDEALQLVIVEACRKVLAAHKVPASIRFVSSIEVASSGKLVRSDA